jgi:hypothetical protein
MASRHRTARHYPSAFPFGAADKAGFNELDREWTRHQKMNGLDAYGSRPES